MGVMLSKGSTGPEVKELQAAMNFHIRAPATPLKPDGIFGQLTDARVREFQRLAKIKDDGIVGPATIKAIYRVLQGAAEAKVATRPAREHALASGSMRAGLGAPRVVGFGQRIAPAAPGLRLTPPAPQARTGASQAFTVENKLVFNPLGKPGADHTVQVSIAPSIPWPVFLPAPLKLDIDASAAGNSQFSLEGKLKVPFKLVDSQRLELKPYFFVGAGMEQNHFKDINAGAVASVKLKLLPNIGGSGVSLGLEADGGVKYTHDVQGGEGKFKGILGVGVGVEYRFK